MQNKGRSSSCKCVTQLSDLDKCELSSGGIYKMFSKHFLPSGFFTNQLNDFSICRLFTVIISYYIFFTLMQQSWKDRVRCVLTLYFNIIWRCPLKPFKINQWGRLRMHILVVVKQGSYMPWPNESWLFICAIKLFWVQFLTFWSTIMIVKCIYWQIIIIQISLIYKIPD